MSKFVTRMSIIAMIALFTLVCCVIIANADEPHPNAGTKNYSTFSVKKY